MEWLSSWYADQCDGDWEHDNQLKIETLDNPGWDIEISLKDTGLDIKDFDSGLIEKSELDWHRYFIKNGRYVGYGDPSKLGVLLRCFREIVEAAERDAR